MFGFTCVVSKSVEGRLVEFRPRWPLAAPRLGRGYFRLWPAPAGGAVVEATVELGVRTPLVGAALDWLIERIVDMKALEAHMRDEGHNIAEAVRSVAERDQETRSR